MFTLSSYSWLLVFFLLNLYLSCLYADSNFSFSYKNFDYGSNFESQIALIGDAKLVNDTRSVEISGSGDYNTGKLIWKKPFSLVSGNSTNGMAFSSYFVFSVPRNNGNKLAFFMLPSDFPLNYSDINLVRNRKHGLLCVEFDAFVNEKYGDLRTKRHISVKQSHVSSFINLKLYTDEKLQGLINYEATGKRIEVSLRKFGTQDPYIPLISYSIDLSALWNEQRLAVGLMSSSRNSSQKTNIYSWSFVSRNVKNFAHSFPMNTNHFAGISNEVKQSKKSDCGTGILLALIFGAACGSLVALLVVFIWRLVGVRLPVTPEVIGIHDSNQLEFKKVDFVAVKTIQNGKN